MKRETSRQRTKTFHHHRHSHALFVVFHVFSPDPFVKSQYLTPWVERGACGDPPREESLSFPINHPILILILQCVLLQFVIYVHHLHYDRRQNSHMDSGDAVYVKQIKINKKHSY